MTDLNLRAARIQLYGLMTAVVVAILIAAGITTGAFVLSFSVLKDLAVQATLPAAHSWIFPAIVDGGILGATVAVVVLSKISGGATGRKFFLWLLIAVVVVSVGGNAYHAYKAAERAAQQIAAGADLGFTPLAPSVAPLIAVIPPLLVLAFTHGIGILIKAIGTAYSEYNQLVNATDATALATPHTTAATLDIAATRAPAETAAADDHTAPAPAYETESAVRSVDAPETVAPGETAIADRVAPVAQHVASIASDSAPVAHEVEVPHTAATAALDRATTFEDDTAHGPEQTTAALLEFIEHAPGLSPEVRETARLKFLNPDMTFAAIAAQTGGVATSTALRRYNKAEHAALAAGFTMPPLPDLTEGAFTSDGVDTRELVVS